MSQPKTIEESLGSSPSKGKSPMSGLDQENTTLPTGKKFPLRVETPTLPPQGEPAFIQFAADDLSAGNHDYVINRKERGLLGHFRDREKIIPVPLPIAINPANLHAAFYNTLHDYFTNALRKKADLNDNEIARRAQSCALQLADGCSIMTYLKVRNIIISEYQDEFDANYLKRPRIGNDHVIPLPFAFAIQQLGIVNAVDLEYEIRYAPLFPKEGHVFGLTPDRIWNPNSYYDAVVYAKTLGMQFSIVDLKEKKGTAWWLLQPYFDEDIFELRCTLPETNFSPAMALTYALFLSKNANGPATTVFDTSSLTDTIYGTLLRSPHNGINLSAFEGIANTEQEVWSHV